MGQDSTYAKGRLTRARILAAASRIFAEKGFHRTSLQEVLGEIGATKGAFYHHWSSKEELALEIMQRLREEYERLMEPALAGAKTGIEMAKNVFEVYNQINLNGEFLAIRIFLTFLMGLSKEEEPRLYDIIQNGVRENYELWVTIVSRGQEDGTIRKDLCPHGYAELVNAAWFGMHVCKSEDDIPDATAPFQQNLLRVLRK